jgi:hypothetical protein
VATPWRGIQSFESRTHPPPDDRRHDRLRLRAGRNNNTDPTGLCGFWCKLGIGAAIVGTAVCVVAEPRGAIKGGVALGAGGTAVATGVSVSVAPSVIAGAVAGGLIGGMYAYVSNSQRPAGGQLAKLMVGRNGARVTPNTTYNKGRYRTDVENPIRGQARSNALSGPGQPGRKVLLQFRHRRVRWPPPGNLPRTSAETPRSSAASSRA